MRKRLLKKQIMSVFQHKQVTYILIKREVFIFLLLTFIPFVTKAQALSESQSNFKGGVRAGITATQISGDDLSGFNKLGAYTGVYVNFPIHQNGRWFIQTELNFIMKGSALFTRGVNDPNIGQRYTLTLFYTETPLIVKYKIYKGLDLELGPTFNFLFAYREIGDEGSLKPIRPKFSVFELSILAGVNYLFKDHWGVSFRFTNSILPVRKPTWKVNEKFRLQYNTAMALSVYYQF